MTLIKVLSDELIGKIRAGEVIERPASVVKELVENSLDAGARKIGVEVSGGGTGFISVTDDGEGMHREDALLCLERHSTSKLAALEDLMKIKTMGFRGEAVPSIASVSRMRLLTAPRGASAGTSITCEGGRIVDVRDAPALGTTVQVRDLFFNTPARKKFLKRKSTELLHVVNTVTKAALSNPRMGFRLLVEGDVSIDLPQASGMRERLVQVYGSEFVDGLVNVSADSGGLSLEGFVSKGGNFRNSRSHQFIFINGRTVREPSLSHAAMNAYDGAVPGGRHPVLFLYYSVDPERLDVNVHPRKEEVRFADREVLYRFTLGAVRRAVGIDGGPTTGGDHLPAEGPAQSVQAQPYAQAVAGYPAGAPAFGEMDAAMVSEALALDYRAGTQSIYLGETFVAYPDLEGGLSLIDFHAAHERVLYEELLKGAGLAAKPESLLFPRQVKLSPVEYRVIKEHAGLLGRMGIEVEDFGADTVMVRTLPGALKEADIRGILSDAAEELKEGAKPGPALIEAVAARVACHGSVRGGGRRLSGDELSALLVALDKCEDPEHCPHGRPTRLRFTLNELRKLFKRT